MIKEIKEKKYLFGAIILLTIITFLTSFYGSTDVFDYSNTAKFFAGQYDADIRSSHSYFYGFMHTPFVKIFENFLVFKVTSIIFLLLIIYSVFIITGKNKKSLWLCLLSPVVWYMGPWISPIQLASLFVLWAWYFMVKFDKSDNLRYLLFSGIFIGLGWAVWDTILYFGIFLAASFLLNKKVYSSGIFVIAIFIGLLPRLILDHYYFDFAFFTIIKTIAGNFSATYFGGIYVNDANDTLTVVNLILFFVTIPVYFWKLYNKKFLKAHAKTMVFLTLSILMILTNPQIRFALIILPIIFVILSFKVSEEKIRKSSPIFLAVIIIFLIPYIIHIGYSLDDRQSTTGREEITYYVKNLGDIDLVSGFPKEKLQSEISQIVLDTNSDIFIVGNSPDSYAEFAHFYWGDEIGEFVSIQDYKIFLNNNSVIFERRFEFEPNINNRRAIWFGGGMTTNPNDQTNYDSIKYALSLDGEIDLENFSFVKKYNSIYLFEKAN